MHNPQRLDQTRTLVAELTLAFYPHGDTASDIKRPPVQLHSNDLGSGSRVEPLLMLSLDELGPDHVKAAIAHTLNHRIPAIDLILQNPFNPNKEMVIDAYLATIFLHSYAPGKYKKDQEVTNFGEQYKNLSHSDTKPGDDIARRKLLHDFWEKKIYEELRFFLRGGDKVAALDNDTLINAFCRHSQVETMKKSDMAIRGSAFLKEKRELVAAVLEELSPEERLLLETRGVVTVFTQSLGNMVKDIPEAHGASLDLTWRVFMNSRSSMPVFYLKEEFDHQLLAIIGAQNYPLVKKAVAELVKDRGLEFEKLKAAHGGGPNYDSPETLELDVLTLEYLVDAKRIAEAKSAEIKASEPGLSPIDNRKKVDDYMKAEFPSGLWEARKHCDEEVKAWAFVAQAKRSTGLEEERQSSSREFRDRIAFDTGDSSLLGRRF